MTDRTSLILTDDFPTPRTKLKSFRLAVAEHANCVGLWRFDNESLLTRVSTLVSSMANWKAGGPTLEQATAGDRVGTTTDAITGRQIGSFVNATSQYYTISGASMNALLPFTIGVIVKPVDLGQTTVIAGSQGGGEDAYIGLAGNFSARAVYGTGVAVGPVLAANKWCSILMSYDGASKIPFISVNGGSPIGGTTAATEVTVINQFRLSQSTAAAFQGSFGAAALFNTNMLTNTGNAQLLEDWENFASAWKAGL